MFGLKFFWEALIKIPLPKRKLFAKSIFTLILKVSDKLTESEKCRSRDFCDSIDTSPKWRFEIWPFLI